MEMKVVLLVDIVSEIFKIPARRKNGRRWKRWYDSVRGTCARFRDKRRLVVCNMMRLDFNSMYSDERELVLWPPAVHFTDMEG